MMKFGILQDPSRKMPLYDFTNGKTKRGNTLSGTLLRTYWQKHFRHFIQTQNLELAQPLKMVSITTLIRVMLLLQKLIYQLSRRKCWSWLVKRTVTFDLKFQKRRRWSFLITILTK